jgi:hypothetical protein
MLAKDTDVGSNGVLSFSTVYIDTNENNHVFGVRADTTDPKKAVLYSRVTFDRESSNYGQMIYNETVIVTVCLYYVYVNWMFCSIIIDIKTHLNYKIVLSQSCDYCTQCATLTLC